MLSLELFQKFFLLELIAGRLAHLLLALVKHHLLDHCPRLAVEIAQFAVFGSDLGGVDLGRRRDDMLPPFHLVGLVEVDAYLLALGNGFEGPGGVIDEDGSGKVAIDDGVLALDCNPELALGDLHVEVPALVVSRNGNGEIHILDGLGPLVGQLGLLGSLSGALLGVQLCAFGRRR